MILYIRLRLFLTFGQRPGFHKPGTLLKLCTYISTTTKLHNSNSYQEPSNIKYNDAGYIYLQVKPLFNS